MPLLAAASAAAAVVLPSAAEAAPTTVLKVRECQTGKTAKERTATFYGRMRAVSGTYRMQMRFTLVDRTASPTAIKAPALSRWRRSRPGVTSFGYAQTVSALRPGASYAVTVDYRWVSAGGKTIRSLRRTSHECRQDGKLPNLVATSVGAKRGDAEGTSTYDIEVTNRGSVAARAIDVDLFVDGAGADAAEIDLLEAGERATVRVSGPRCVGRIRAVADRGDTIHETNEDDNALRVRCPAPSF